MSETLEIPAPGSHMTDVRLVGADGERSSLSALGGSDRAVVHFLRAATCPVCLAHARTIMRMSAQGELHGASVVLVVPGDAAEAATAERRLGTGATVWASGTAHAAVGLGTFLMLQHSGTFVLDGSGRVLGARASALPTGSFAKAEVIEALTAA